MAGKRKLPPHPTEDLTSATMTKVLLAVIDLSQMASGGPFCISARGMADRYEVSKSGATACMVRLVDRGILSVHRYGGPHGGGSGSIPNMYQVSPSGRRYLRLRFGTGFRPDMVGKPPTPGLERKRGRTKATPEQNPAPEVPPVPALTGLV